MADLKILVQGDGPIDNASIYLEDPLESIEFKLDPVSDNKWETTVSVPVAGGLDYSLHVLAFSGTRFDCHITDLTTQGTIKFEGKTGTKIKNRANVVGSQNFQA